MSRRHRSPAQVTAEAAAPVAAPAGSVGMGAGGPTTSHPAAGGVATPTLVAAEQSLGWSPTVQLNKGPLGNKAIAAPRPPTASRPPPSHPTPSRAPSHPPGAARPWWADPVSVLENLGGRAMDLRDQAMHGVNHAITGGVASLAAEHGFGNVAAAARTAETVVDGQIELNSGVARALGTMGAGAVRLTTDPDTQLGLARTVARLSPLSAAGDVASEDARQRSHGASGLDRVRAAAGVVANDRVQVARQVGNGLTASAREDWRSGHRMRAVGRVGTDVGTTLLGLGGASGAARAGEVGAVARAGEVGAAARAGEVGAAARAGEVGAAAQAGEVGAAARVGEVGATAGAGEVGATARAAEVGVASTGEAGAVARAAPVRHRVGQMPAINPADAEAGRLGPRNASMGPVGGPAPAPMEVHQMPAVPAEAIGGPAPAGWSERAGPVRQVARGPAPAAAPAPTAAAPPSAQGAGLAPTSDVYQAAWRASGGTGPAPAGGFQTPHGAVLPPQRAGEWGALHGEGGGALGTAPTEAAYNPQAHAPTMQAIHAGATPAPGSAGAALAPSPEVYEAAWRASGGVGPVPAGGFHGPNGPVLPPGRSEEWHVANQIGQAPIGHAQTLVDGARAPTLPAMHAGSTPAPGSAVGSALAPSAEVYERAWRASGGVGPVPVGGFQGQNGSVLPPHRVGEWSLANRPQPGADAATGHARTLPADPALQPTLVDAARAPTVPAAPRP